MAIRCQAHTVVAVASIARRHPGALTVLPADIPADTAECALGCFLRPFTTTASVNQDAPIVRAPSMAVINTVDYIGPCQAQEQSRCAPLDKSTDIGDGVRDSGASSNNAVSIAVIAHAALPVESAIGKEHVARCRCGQPGHGRALSRLAPVSPDPSLSRAKSRQYPALVTVGSSACSPLSRPPRPSISTARSG